MGKEEQEPENGGGQGDLLNRIQASLDQSKTQSSEEKLTQEGAAFVQKMQGIPVLKNHTIKPSCMGGEAINVGDARYLERLKVFVLQADCNGCGNSIYADSNDSIWKSFGH